MYAPTRLVSPASPTIVLRQVKNTDWFLQSPALPPAGDCFARAGPTALRLAGQDAARWIRTASCRRCFQVRMGFLQAGQCRPPRCPCAAAGAYLFFIKTTIPTITSTRITRSASPQRGAVTHHHDQSITFVNFRIRNTTNSIPVRPTLQLLLCSISFIPSAGAGHPTPASQGGGD